MNTSNTNKKLKVEINMNENTETQNYIENFENIVRCKESTPMTEDGKSTIITDRIYSNGHLCSVKHFEEGELVSEEIYAFEGHLASVLKYNKGKLISDTIYYPDGSISQKNKY